MMLTRKGTMSRKNRASMRRGRGGRGGASAGACAPGGGGVSSTAACPLGKTPASLGTPSLSAPHLGKSSSSKGVSFSTSVDNYCYAMDTLSTSSEICRGFVNHTVDGNHVHDGVLIKDKSAGASSTCDLSSTDLLGYNYQSVAIRKDYKVKARMKVLQNCFQDDTKIRSFDKQHSVLPDMNNLTQSEQDIPMFTRTGTIVRKQRRRSSTTSKHSVRRESATTPTPSMCHTPSPSPSPSVFSYDPVGNQLPSRHPPTSFTSPFPTPDPSPLSNGQFKGVNFTFDFKAINSHFALSKLTPPPSDKPIYESTVIWTEVEDADTHYSVIGSLCEASVEARHPCDFIHRSMFIICRTWPVTVFTLVLLALPLVMTAIGVNYLHECPREPKLPIYLVVGGCFGIIKLIFLLWKQIKRHRDDVIDLHDDDDLLTMTRMTNMALNVFLSVWFVFGHYWLIRIWKPHFEAPLHEPRNWCDETVFLFTFWQLVICHMIISVVIVIAIILYCCYVCVKCCLHDDRRHQHQQQADSKKPGIKR